MYADLIVNGQRRENEMAEKQDTYGDEDFIYLIAGQQKKPVYENNIYDGFIVIDGDNIPFTKRKLIGGITMMMPEKCEIMSKEKVERKYGTERVPNIVYSFNYGDVHMSLSYKEKIPSEDEDIIMLRGLLEHFTMDEMPQPDDKEDSLPEAQGKPVAYLDFTAETNILLFFFSYKASLTIGSIECVKSDIAEWRPVFLQMLESLSEPSH